MELIKPLPEFNLYEDFWKIYTNSDHQPPTYTAADAVVRESLITDGGEIYGEVLHSILGSEVIVGKGSVVRDSIIMGKTVIGENTVIDHCIIDEDCEIGSNVIMGQGENIPSETKPNIYNSGITVIGSNTRVPDGITIGKNCVIFGRTNESDYLDGKLESGKSVVREGK